MIGLTAKVVDETPNVEEAVEKAAYKNLGHAAASIRKEAIVSIEKSAKPATAGDPPHTRKGDLRKAIRYAREDKWTAVIGPRASAVSESGAAHEHGGQYMGQTFPSRPFMGPALETCLDRFRDDWRGAVR